MPKLGCENYTFKNEQGEMITIKDIPSAEVRALSRNLNISHREALELWCFDHDKIGNAEADALTAKAKASGAGMRASGDKKRKAPTRKPDDVKRALIVHFAEALGAFEGVDTVNVEKIERLITFSIGDDSYKLTLSKDRKPKN